MNLDSYWYWLIAAAALAAAEMLVPGVFLIWIAAAALLTGLITLAGDPGVAIQLALFALFSVLASFGGRAWYKANPVPSADPLLNDRVSRLVGETVELTTAIVNGRGRARVGDSEWNVRGPDANAGTCMRVVGMEDGALVVRPLTALPREAGSTSHAG